MKLVMLNFESTCTDGVVTFSFELADSGPGEAWHSKAAPVVEATARPVNGSLLLAGTIAPGVVPEEPKAEESEPEENPPSQ